MYIAYSRVVKPLAVNSLTGGAVSDRTGLRGVDAVDSREERARYVFEAAPPVVEADVLEVAQACVGGARPASTYWLAFKPQPLLLF